MRQHVLSICQHVLMRKWDITGPRQLPDAEALAD
jgi:hypothetical protein